MAQGYVLQNNFFESQTGASDRGILDNLSYVGATNDILLFDGNLRAVSTLKAIESPVVELTDFTFNATNKTISSLSANFGVFVDGETITISNTTLGGNDGTFTVDGTPTQTVLTVLESIVDLSGDGKIVGESTPNYEVNPLTFEVIITGEGIVPFSEGTLVAYGTQDDGENAGSSQNAFNYQYVVINSDTLTRFSLADPATPNTPIDLTTVYGNSGDAQVLKNISRKDSIIQSDLFNLNTPRTSTSGAGTVSGGEGEDPGGADAGGVGTSIFDSNSIGAQVEFISGKVALFAYKKGRVPITNRYTKLDSNVTFNGSLRLTNVNSVQIDPIIDEDSGGGPPYTPGIYIRGSDGSVVKAFTDLSNPWEADNPSATPGANVATDALKTTTGSDDANIIDVKINELKFFPDTGAAFDPTFIFTAGNGLENGGGDISQLVNSYTHKMPTYINGELYFMLLKKR